MARRRTARRRLEPRRILILLGVALVAYLYYHPLRSYVATKHDLSHRAAEVRSLRAQKRSLERQLRQASTPEALAREARMQLSLVRPGERLFIVKGIPAWRKAHGLGS